MADSLASACTGRNRIRDKKGTCPYLDHRGRSGCIHYHSVRPDKCEDSGGVCGRRDVRNRAQYLDVSSLGLWTPPYLDHADRLHYRYATVLVVFISGN